MMVSMGLKIKIIITLTLLYSEHYSDRAKKCSIYGGVVSHILKFGDESRSPAGDVTLLI